MRSKVAQSIGERVCTSLVVVLITAALLPACRSKLDVKSKSGGSAATEGPEGPLDDGNAGDEGGDDGTTPVKEEPREVKEALALSGEKLYFQTRDVITMTIDETLLEGGTSYRLLNTTKSGNDDSKAIVLAEDTISLGLHDGFALVSGNGKLQFQFFPGEQEWAGKFFYGKNTLKLFVDDEERPRYSLTELYLVDFDVFGVAVTAFADNVQVASVSGSDGYQMQGWVNTLSPASVQANGGVLTHGLFNLVNPN